MIANVLSREVPATGTELEALKAVIFCGAGPVRVARPCVLRRMALIGA